MSSVIRSIVPTSFGLRLAFWYSSLFVICSALCFGLAYYLTASSLRKYDEAQIARLANELAVIVEAEGPRGLEQHLAQRANFGKVAEYYVRLVDARGARLVEHLSQDGDDFLTDDPLAQPPTDAAKGSAWSKVPEDDDDDDEVLELFSRRLPQGMWLQVGRSSEEREELLETFRERFLLIFAPLLLFGPLGGFILTHRALRPIRELIQTVRTIKSGELSARVPRSVVSDELDTLKGLFNEMLDRIEALLQGMRQTTDGLAHDIRTPITRLRANAELALEDAADDHDRREALATTIENAEQIMALVDVLLDVSEAEAGTLNLSLAPVSLQKVIADVAELYLYAAEDKGIKLEVTETEAVVIADGVRLRQAIANLVDNAIKYTPAGGWVGISTVKTAAFATVHISDSGPGIPLSEIPHIWKRLYRGDQSRSERGMGLGLSLVKAIAEVHGGSVCVDSAEGQGATFKLSLPLDAASPRA